MTDMKPKKNDLDSGLNLGLIDSQAIFKDKSLNLSNINASEEDIQILQALPSMSKDPNNNEASPSGVGMGLGLPDLSAIEAENSID